jgi:acyl-homoserine-lactone acylase
MPLPCDAGGLAGTGHGEILWDRYGVPHIYGSTVEDVIYGFGYAQMKNHAETIFTQVAAARGRLAEYFGPGPGNDEPYVLNDKGINIHGIYAQATDWANKGNAEQRRFLDLFTAGMEAYLDEHPLAVDKTFTKIAPITPADIMAVILHSHYSVLRDRWYIADQIAKWCQGPGPAALQCQTKPQQLASSSNLGGSNGWALAPAKSASGGAILMANPHLAWGANSVLSNTFPLTAFFEANLVVGEPDNLVLNVSGVANAGVPFLNIAYSNDIAWTETWNNIKNIDLYEVVSSPAGGYFYDGTHRAFENVFQYQIKVLQPDGSLITETFKSASTVHGPIVAKRTDGHLLALRTVLAPQIAGQNGSFIVSEFWNRLRAHNLEEFTAATKTLQMPYQNIISADRQGKIMYMFGGWQPKRDGGWFKDYEGILDGSTHKTLWTQTLTWSELPKTSQPNPEGGYVQNCNDPPWSSTIPPAVGSYPAWLAPEYILPRPQNSLTFLGSQKKFTADDVNAGKESTLLVLAQRILPDLTGWALANKDTYQAGLALAECNRTPTADANSKGCALFDRWYEIYTNTYGTPRSSVYGKRFPAFAQEWSKDQPLTTPYGLASGVMDKEKKAVLAALSAAATELQNEHLPLDVAWGIVHRDELYGHDSNFKMTFPPVANMPASGARSNFGPMRVLDATASGAARVDWGGDSYILIVEFVPQAGVKARSLLVYGNSSRPGSHHIADQLALFEEKQLRPALRSQFDVRANTVDTDRY